jgi:hypothetical protein
MGLRKRLAMTNRRVFPMAVVYAGAILSGLALAVTSIPRRSPAAEGGEHAQHDQQALHVESISFGLLRCHAGNYVLGPDLEMTLVWLHAV